MLNITDLRSLLPPSAAGTPWEFHERIGSTNDRALELGQEGAPHGTFVLASEQTAGRGRRGRTWRSPPGESLSLSYLWRRGEPYAARVLTGMAALAVCRAIEDLGGTPQIKWPNDVLLNGKKAAGILTETSWHGSRFEYAVLGLGVNLGPASIPAQADFPATCLEHELEQAVAPNHLAASLLHHLSTHQNEHEIISDWERRLAYRDRAVVLEDHVRGIVLGLGPEGELRLEREGGAEVTVARSESHLRPVDMQVE